MEKNYEAFFREEGKELQYVFSEDMDIVFEEIKAIEIIRNSTEDHRTGKTVC